MESQLDLQHKFRIEKTITNLEHKVDMRILNLDGHYFISPFRKMGHEVLWLGPMQDCDIQVTSTISLARLMALLQERSFVPDIVVWSDICRPPSVMGIESLPGVTIGFSIDQYCNPWHIPYSAAFDLMLIAQKDYVPLFQREEYGHELEWFPLFCDPAKDIDQGRERDIPVSFVGTVEGSINSDRKIFLDGFKKLHPIFTTQGNYVPIYNRSKMVLNQSAVGELNFRIFEAMACGAALLTEKTENGLKDLFIEGEDILFYQRGNPASAATAAKEALAGGSLDEIAAKGRRKVLANHTSTIRAKHILNRAETLLSKKTTWRKQNTATVNMRVATAYNILATDTQLPISDELRTLYGQLAKQMLQSEK